jgi:hypothetical protein
MYGHTRHQANHFAAFIRAQEPGNVFEVTPHSWHPGFYTRSEGKVNEEAARTWGVVRWVPYCDKVPLRNTGFVAFDPAAHREVR